jgi:catechol 2,3-dioxygenase-like lactoylglutathione lyase family enzyme
MIKLDHLTLRVSDHRKSRDWYMATLGLKVEFEVPQRPATALQDDAGFTLFVEQGPEPPAPGCALYFQVEDVEARHRQLTSQGVGFVHGPRTAYWGYGAELADPDGYTIRLWDETSMRDKGGG